MVAHDRNTSLLRLLQLSDTAFPTGSFAHSMGLEAFAGTGRLRSAEDLERLAGIYLNSLSTSDCVALRAAYAARLDEVVEIDRLLSATKLTRELRSASTATGGRFLASVAALGVEEPVLEDYTRAVRGDEAPGNMAVGYGVAAPALGLGVEEALLSYLYAAASSLVAAGQKLIPIGGSAAQRVLYRLDGEITRAVEKSEEVPLEDMYAFAPEVDVRSMLHERQRVRLYIS
ncbi:MAG: urease accessory protein UreF [Actinobacteria bacterium]|nr:urease accessory protein UreF [Actinomycetota bacterium]